MRDAVIVEALRTPIARGKMGKGELSGFHAAQLLGRVQRALVERAGIQPQDVEQIFGGCVTQAGEQSNNIARNAWLGAQQGDYSTAGTTIDAQCGSGQQANNLVSALIKAGSIDCGIACGVEVMSHVGLGANVMNGPGFFLPPDWPWDDADSSSSRPSASRRSAASSASRRDELALRSQRLAKQARDEGRFKREILPIDAPALGDDGKPTGQTVRVDAGPGHPRDHACEGLAALKPVQEGGIHTAGNSSQISDGAAALLWMSAGEGEGARPPAARAHPLRRRGRHRSLLPARRPDRRHAPRSWRRAA